MTLVFNIVLALALIFAFSMFFLLRRETSTQKGNLAATTAGTQAETAAKMEVDLRLTWQGFALAFAALIIASVTIIN